MVDKSDKFLGDKAKIAGGAVIGSAAIAAALLFVKRNNTRKREKPAHPEQAPETD